MVREVEVTVLLAVCVDVIGVVDSVQNRIDEGDQERATWEAIIERVARL